MKLYALFVRSLDGDGGGHYDLVAIAGGIDKARELAHSHALTNEMSCAYAEPSALDPESFVVADVRTLQEAHYVCHETALDRLIPDVMTLREDDEVLMDDADAVNEEVG